MGFTAYRSSYNERIKFRFLCFPLVVYLLATFLHYCFPCGLYDPFLRAGKSGLKCSSSTSIFFFVLPPRTVFLINNIYCVSAIRLGRQMVNIPSFLLRLESQKHIDFANTSPLGGGLPGRAKRKNMTGSCWEGYSWRWIHEDQVLAPQKLSTLQDRKAQTEVVSVGFEGRWNRKIVLKFKNPIKPKYK